MANDELHTNPISGVKLPHDRKKLEALAKSVSENIKVWEGGIMIPAAFLVLAIAILGTAYQEFLRAKVMTVLILVMISAGLGIVFIRTMMRRRLPFLTLTPEGLETSVFAMPVAWRGITDFEINGAKTNAYNVAIGMEFTIDDHFLPEQNEKCRGSSYYDEKKKKLLISGFNFRLDMNRDKLIELINQYRIAAMARHKLQMKEYS